EENIPTQEEEEKEKDITESDMYKDLRQYRLIKSREEKIKPYVIYSNKQLEDLILKMPKTLEELYGVERFGKARVDRYGEDILQIIEGYRG
ncbi:MAG TPA: helicase, partial [Epulopiscium sp.]|nr:helicase [Candidatus Epulonipiscium sp.]